MKGQATNSQDWQGTQFNVSALLEYQAGAVVSKEILRKNTGTVTLFAFDKSQGLSEHTAPFDATVFIIDGTAKVTVSGKSHRVKKGEMIVMPADKPHALMALTPFKMLLIMIKG